jgi:single-stranded DNA-binding protein
MQLFYGTLTIKSRPVDDGVSTNCDGAVNSILEKEVATPIKVKAYGKAGGRLENLTPGTRIQILNGTIHRGQDYSYLIKPYRFIVLPEDSGTDIPDWHSIILAGRTTNQIDINDQRSVVMRSDFLSVTRPIAVNRAKNEADFFDVQAISNANDRINKAQNLMDYFGHKGTFLMIDGRLSSRQGKDKSGDTKVYTKIQIERLYYGPKTSAASSGANGTGDTYAAAGGQYYRAEAHQPMPANAMPSIPEPGDVPF